MGYWSFWVSGAALAAVPLFNWFATRRAFGVSGRYTALVDALRFRGEGAAETAPDQAALIEALRAQTALDLGLDALEDVAPSEADVPVLTAEPTPRSHGLFLAGLALGGALATFLTGAWQLTPGLRGAGFAHVVEALGVPAPLLLLFGGTLVGFGTRMAGGCTSGHGLCGVSQFQPGSLLATAAFFGAAVAVSFALGALS